MLNFYPSIPRGKQYGARATIGHYSGRSIKDVSIKSPAASAVEESMFSKDYPPKENLWRMMFFQRQ